MTNPSAAINRFIDSTTTIGDNIEQALIFFSFSSLFFFLSLFSFPFFSRRRSRQRKQRSENGVTFRIKCTWPIQNTYAIYRTADRLYRKLYLSDSFYPTTLWTINSSRWKSIGPTHPSPLRPTFSECQTRRKSKEEEEENDILNETKRKLTFCTTSGVPKSFPPWRRKPQGDPSNLDSLTLINWAISLISFYGQSDKKKKRNPRSEWNE